MNVMLEPFVKTFNHKIGIRLHC